MLQQAVSMRALAIVCSCQNWQRIHEYNGKFLCYLLFDVLFIETHPYLAYSSPGKVRGKPVYVNFGLAEDFEVLKTRGVTLNGTIAIMRYGRGQALDAKIRRAEENGIQGKQYK